jgi:hypothetical protein
MSEELELVGPDDNNLTPDQETFVLENWKTMDLITMVQALSGDPKADGRHKLGRAIRVFLSSKGFEAKTTKYKAIGPIELNQEQLDYISQNADRSKPLEMARILFGNSKLTPLSREFKAVYIAVEKISKNFVRREEAPAEEDIYYAPKSIYKLIPRVNKYVPNPKNEIEPLFPDIKKISGTEEKNLRTLLSYLNIPRFSYQANQFHKEVDRELFESTFIGMTWDKSDLKREEVEQYISLSSEVVQTAQIERHIQRLDREIEDSMSGENDRKLSLNLIELVNGAREKLDKSKERQKKLINNLTDSRAERLKKRIQENSSILNLVDAWRNEKRRQELIQLAILQKKAEEADIDKITSMSDVTALIAGLTKGEVLKTI